MRQLTYFQILSFAVIAIIAVSCSSEPKVAAPQKSYSSSTEREFEAIEKNDLRINAPYRSSTKAPPHPPVLIKEVPAKKQSETTLTRQLTTKNQERLHEINQNLAFFCMKHRKDVAFRNEEHCLAFTKKVLMACEKKHKLINMVMVNCIKTQLKKRP